MGDAEMVEHDVADKGSGDSLAPWDPLNQRGVVRWTWTRPVLLVRPEWTVRIVLDGKNDAAR